MPLGRPEASGSTFAWNDYLEAHARFLVRGADGPGEVALIDHDSFDVTGAWESDRGEQHFAYDVWWRLNEDVAITSEWATPSMIEDGLNPEDLLGRRFGHHLDFWSLSDGRLIQRVDLGDEHQMVLELRPAHDPRRTWGFVGVVISVEDLSASVWLWYREDDRRTAKKVISIPAEPAESDRLPPALKPFGAVPPLVTDIDLSVDDRWLYVSCWGTGELKRYDVSDPHNPREAGSVRLGGIVSRTPPPAAAELSLGGAPQMVEVSRDGRRVYATQLALRLLGRDLLPGRRRRLDGPHRRGHRVRRHDPRPAVLPARGRLPRAAGASDPPPGRGRVERLVLLRGTRAGRMEAADANNAHASWHRSCQWLLTDTFYLATPELAPSATATRSGLGR